MLQDISAVTVCKNVAFQEHTCDSTIPLLDIYLQEIPTWGPSRDTGEDVPHGVTYAGECGST